MHLAFKPHESNHEDFQTFFIVLAGNIQLRSFTLEIEPIRDMEEVVEPSTSELNFMD